MPPLHPALVHYPLALVLFSFIADLFGYLRNNAALSAAGFWSLVGAGVGGALAVAAGYYDMSRASLSETHGYVDFHMDVGWVLLVSVVVLTLWRWLLYRRERRRLNWIYLVAAFLVLGLTFFQGWYGGEMVYSQGAGVAAAGKGTETPDAGHARLDRATKLLGGGDEHHGGEQDEHRDQH